MKELPEADVVIGTGEIGRISEICEQALSGKERVLKISGADDGLRPAAHQHHAGPLPLPQDRRRAAATAVPTAPFRIIRGNFTSRPHQSILDEARRLADEGAKELVLLAQDSTAYRDGEADLPLLLKALTRITGIEWVRLMYAYPGRISAALMTVMAEEEKICKYLDIPIQHFDDKVLAAMNRRGTSEDIRKTIEQLRKRVPGIALRTSLIVGFPGRDRGRVQAAALVCQRSGIRAPRRVHLFPGRGDGGLRPESAGPGRDRGGPARPDHEGPGEDIVQEEPALIGTRQRVLIDGMEDMALIGRLQTQAPEIDGVVYLSETEAEPGAVRRGDDHRCHGV